MLDACAEAREAIDALALVVLSFAESEAETVMPGYTHLQRAQPVTLGHHLLAWVEMLDRDRTRFAAAAEAASESPLGAGALAGSTLELPPPPRQLRNSIDAVADRDFALDYLYAAAVLFTHLSRIGEEIVLWATSEFGFVRLPESAATGSSMMPQKLNPDVAELVRGKAGTAIGRLTGLLATVKGLPLAYDRDLQEDKAPVFATRHETRLALEALTVLVSGLEVDRDRMAKAASDPLLLATDAAEALVREGVPFRDAHEQVAESVRDGNVQEAAQGREARVAGPGRHSRGARRSAPPLPRQPVRAGIRYAVRRSEACVVDRPTATVSASCTRRWKSAMSFSLSPISRPCGTAPDSSPRCTDCTSETSSSATWVSQAMSSSISSADASVAEVVVGHLDRSAEPVRDVALERDVRDARGDVHRRRREEEVVLRLRDVAARLYGALPLPASADARTGPIWLEKVGCTCSRYESGFTSITLLNPGCAVGQW